MKQKITITLFIVIIFVVLFWACKEKELPKITSINKIELSITEDSTSYVFAQLKCDLNQNPKFEIEQYGFCWDTVTNVTIAKESNSFENLTNQSFTETIENLLPNKTYYVKAYIQNGDVIIYSNELTIQTLDARPIVTTTNISSITANSAQAGGEVEAYETLFPITQRGVCWAKTQNPTIADSLTSNGTGNGTFTSQLQNLEIGAIYFVRAYAINSEGISYGDEKNFTTLDGIPELTTDSIKNITATSATFYANIIENDGLEILEKGFCWSLSTNPTIENSTQVVSGNILGSFNAEITGLEIDTTYYVKAYIKNSEGIFYSNEILFTTDHWQVLTTKNITNITATSALSGGNITDNGGAEITTRGICWSLDVNPTIEDDYTLNGFGVGTFESELLGLTTNTTYYVRAYATNINGTVYGNQLNFTTDDGIPTLTTSSISNITAISASSGGNISDDGGAPITERGVCWSTSQNPTITNDFIPNGSGLGSFSVDLNELDASTTYYVRAYAMNITGTTYGNEVSFTTDDGIPSFSTIDASNISTNSAESGCIASDDGGLGILAVGVCWSTNTNPTINDNKTIDGSAIGTYSSNLNNLIELTTYYIRSYVTNESGTFYGNEISFTTYGELMDYDGNVYKSVIIGNQIWMAENLKTTHFPNGDEINLVEDNTSWSNLSWGAWAYCYFDNSVSNGDIYGALYTWGAAMHGSDSSNTNPSEVQGVCPDGWHLPSYAEWDELKNFLSIDVGGKLKEEGTIHWNAPNTGATNETGFTALPGGSRQYYGSFVGELGDEAFFWSTTESYYDNNNAWFFKLSYDSTLPGYGVNTKSAGFSVRCVKD